MMRTLWKRQERAAVGRPGEGVVAADRESGFTLGEVLVSMLIAAAAVLAVSTLIAVSGHNTSKSRQMTSALSLSQSLAESIRAVRAQDLTTIPWNLTSTHTWILDTTNPLPGLYDRSYRVDCPSVPAAGTLPLDRERTIQITIMVRSKKVGSITGHSYGNVHSRKPVDLIFYMRDPNAHPVTGAGGLCP